MKPRFPDNTNRTCFQPREMHINLHHLVEKTLWKSIIGYARVNSAANRDGITKKITFYWHIIVIVNLYAYFLSVMQAY